MKLRANHFIGDAPLNTLIFTDDQVIASNSEYNLEKKKFSLNNTGYKLNFKTST
jgi:hypothetical protein